jgi:hypothetical protein
LTKVVQGQATYVFPQAKGRVSTGFVPGSNWRDFAVSEFGCFAIQMDGSLWDLSAVQPGTRNAESKLKRVGDSRGWKQIAAGWGHYCALKSDGTLWQWGYRLVPVGKRASQEELHTPTQVGTDTDWVAVADSSQSTLAVKSDGTVWRWGSVQYWSTNGPANSETLTRPKRWLAFPGPQRPVSIGFDGYAMAAVCDDGTLWVGGTFLSQLLGPEAAGRAGTEMVRLGNDSDWKSVELLATPIPVGIRRNGSLWKWDVGAVIWPHVKLITAPLAPVSQYAVWTCACSYGNAFLALARDDTLCLWGEPNPIYFDRTGPEPGWLLRPSRILAREIADLGHARD